jgi:DNA-binding beta-propeller fold protein YncE
VICVFGGEVPIHDQKGVFGANVLRDLRFIEINSRLNAGHRHCHEIVVFNRDGKLVENWDQHFDALHENDFRDKGASHSGHMNRIRVNRYDPDRHVWIVGQGNTGIFKITNDGSKIVLKIDASSVPEIDHPFYNEQDVAFLPNGEFLVAHFGYIHRFSEQGEYLETIGQIGSGPVEFQFIHGIEVHPVTNNIYVNDRINQRIQILDPAGHYVGEWPGFVGVVTIRFSEDGNFLWVGNGFAHKFLKYDLEGRFVPNSAWGTFGIYPGAFWGPHYFETDSEGSFYVAEDYTGRIQKMQPMTGTDPADPQLVGILSR